MSLAVAWQFLIVPDGISDVSSEADAIMASLVELEGVDDRLSDSAVGLDLDAMTINIEITVTGQDYQDCVNHALVAIRTAIHTAGGATPGWPSAPGSHVSFEPHDFRAVPAS